MKYSSSFVAASLLLASGFCPLGAQESAETASTIIEPSAFNEVAIVREVLKNDVGLAFKTHGTYDLSFSSGETVRSGYALPVQGGSLVKTLDHRLLLFTKKIGQIVVDKNSSFYLDTVQGIYEIQMNYGRLRVQSPKENGCRWTLVGFDTSIYLEAGTDALIDLSGSSALKISCFAGSLSFFQKDADERQSVETGQTATISIKETTFAETSKEASEYLASNFALSNYESEDTYMHYRNAAWSFYQHRTSPFPLGENRRLGFIQVRQSGYVFSPENASMSYDPESKESIMRRSSSSRQRAIPKNEGAKEKSQLKSFRSL